MRSSRIYQRKHATFEYERREVGRKGREGQHTADTRFSAVRSRPPFGFDEFRCSFHVGKTQYLYEINCAQGKQCLQSRWNFISTSTATNADQRKWRHIRISADQRKWRQIGISLTNGSDVKYVFPRCLPVPGRCRSSWWPPAAPGHRGEWTWPAGPSPGYSCAGCWVCASAKTVTFDIKPSREVNPFTPNIKTKILPAFEGEMHKWGIENWQCNHHSGGFFLGLPCLFTYVLLLEWQLAENKLKLLWKAKFFILCDASIFSETAGEVWNWSLLRVKGFSENSRTERTKECYTVPWLLLTLSLPSSSSAISQPFKEKCINEVERISSTTVF